MPITFTCDCGRLLETHDQYAGRRTRCPSCSAIQVIPAADAVPAVPRQPRCEASDQVTAARPDDRPRRARYAGPEEDIPAVLPAEGPVTKKRPRLRTEHDKIRPRRERDSGSMLEKGALAGLAMMGIAVVWFVGGLAVGIRFYYPPVLFVIGLICFIKGLIDGR